MTDDLFTDVQPGGAEDTAIDWLRLIRSRRVGPTTFWRLMRDSGGAAAALAALPEVARAAGVSGYAPCPEDVARAELAAGAAAGARLIRGDGPGYPPGLRGLADAPPLLWCLGDPALLARPMIAVVGARNASALGVRMARKLAAGLAEAGLVVVSGMARGIDAGAHAAALAGGAGRTVAVMAGGVDVVYPAENAVLAADIARDGLRISEQPPGLVPQARHFPLRNRLISGVARAVVVVEAAGRSGSLITARAALDQGREVLAVPGHPLDARAGGCNALIRDGATLVRGAEDVLAALGPVDPLPGPAAVHPRGDTAAAAGAGIDRQAAASATQGPGDRRPPADPAAARRLHQRILDRLGPSPLAEDQLIRDLGAPPAHVAQLLLTLELDGKILRQAGGLLSRSV